jgi:hypothetical protein
LSRFGVLCLDNVSHGMPIRHAVLSLMAAARSVDRTLDRPRVLDFNLALQALKWVSVRTEQVLVQSHAIAGHQGLTVLPLLGRADRILIRRSLSALIWINLGLSSVRAFGADEL